MLLEYTPFRESSLSMPLRLLLLLYPLLSELSALFFVSRDRRREAVLAGSSAATTLGSSTLPDMISWIVLFLSSTLKDLSCITDCTALRLARVVSSSSGISRNMASPPVRLRSSSEAAALSIDSPSSSLIDLLSSLSEPTLSLSSAAAALPAFDDSAATSSLTTVCSSTLPAMMS